MGWVRRAGAAFARGEPQGLLEQDDDAALRAPLRRPLRFACAEPALPELEVLLEDSLAHLCSTAGARGADVRSLRNGLLIEVLRTAVLPDAEMRRLARDQLIARTWRCAWARQPPRSWNPERRSIF
ncbi:MULTISPECIES: hypothetical protein [Brevundimonas]|uniref:hypothetical protein n=1 Tax=Brevundimonas sp. 357 TaxID=2555782 RepID=UPI0014050984|nr:MULTISPECIES: hypothetical protein [Brevundimonas]